MTRIVVHRFRSAVSGRYVSREWAEANKDISVRETVVLSTDEDCEPPSGRTEKEP
jgi:hypothetical protein